MNFLPISDDILNSAHSSASSFSKTQGPEFADVFAGHMAEQSAALVSNAAPDLAQDYNLSRDDVLSVVNDLSEGGISDDRLNRLNELLNSGESVTPHNIGEALRQTHRTDAEGKPAFAFSDSQRQELGLFLRKMGFSEDSAADALNQLEGGGDVRIWAAMVQRLSMMDPKDTIGVSRSEVDSLGRAFRLNDKQRDMLGKMFGDADKELSPENLKAALATLSQEMAKRNESDVKLAQALQDSFSKLRQSILEREKLEKAADNRGSKEALQKEALFKDSATAKADGKAPAPAKGDDKDYTHNAAQKAADMAKEAALRENAHAQATRDFNEQGHDPRQHGKGDGNADKQQRNSDSLRGAAKAVQKHDSPVADNSSTRSDFIAQMNLNQSAHNMAQHGQGAKNANFSQQVFQQVENGLMSSLADGTKQLNIQLTPENLGTVNVLLSVKNKELTAILRPENPEAAKAIEDQLHVLRLSLEQHGLKVERLEVRPQLQDSTSQAWQGFEQNLGGEAHKKSQEDRLAALFRGRPANAEADDTDTDSLAMPPQTGEHGAGLDIMA